ncbi:MAG: T9SS type A sorting domain-containing protein [Bacteroidetes bacterium]|nr:MAG: T9SS type A sorting domain-containing protein [Bacteroidota bacterium]
MAKKHQRKLWAVVFQIILSITLEAQLPSGTIAPNFTAKDLNGKNWQLYELLDQGKVVVLEISATWCPPCWAYHNGHAMHNFYTQHGPDGDDQARVLFIEGDPATNDQCLYGTAGCNNYSPGNWVNGTPFPIINSAAVADSFQINYYPTIFVVCPNRKVYEVGQWDADDLWEQARSCPVAAGTNNAGIFDYHTGSDLHEVCGSLELQPGFNLVNLGSEALTQATVALQWNNNTIQTIEWQGYRGLYGEVPISFDVLPVNSAGTLEAKLLSVNNKPADDDPANNSHFSEFTIAEGFNNLQVLLKIRTDQYGAETYWEVRDEQGTVLESGGNQAVGPDGGGKFTGINNGPGAYDNNAIIRDTLNLPGAGCYSIHFVDAYGDGMCCDFGYGYYRLYNLDNPTEPILKGGAFRAYDDRGFSAGMLTPVSSVGASEPKVRLYPNPASEQASLALDLPDPARVSVQILNTLGQTVWQFPAETLTAGNQLYLLPTYQFANGLYWAQIQVDAQVINRKLIIAR